MVKSRVLMSVVALSVIAGGVAVGSSAMAEPTKQLGAHNCGSSKVGIQAQVSSLPGDEAQFFVTPSGGSRVYYGFSNSDFKYQTHVFAYGNVTSSGYMADKIGNGLAFCQ